ncbi:MAG: anti-sigma factor [Paracoccaceae bacterium]
MELSDEDKLTAAEHALALDEGELRLAARKRAATDGEFALEVAAWDAAFAGLWDDVAEVAPPARVRRQVMRRLFEGGVRPRSRLWALAPWLLTGTAAAALGAVILTPALRLPDAGPLPPAPVAAPLAIAEIASEDDALRILAAYDPAAGVLRTRRLSALPAPGRDHELWAIPPGGAPVSLGVLRDEGAVELPPELLALLADLTLAVSDEALGGSVTGAPGDVLAAAPVTLL